ncbi:hypothetical protein AMS59_11320 [Lysinibacillus sp. FJAT-14745]|nr:hypothetical protein AMS59_11320 [Lysinibacillus sp. FJAT-14745]
MLLTKKKKKNNTIKSMCINKQRLIGTRESKTLQFHPLYKRQLWETTDYIPIQLYTKKIAFVYNLRIQYAKQLCLFSNYKTTKICHFPLSCSRLFF